MKKRPVALVWFLFSPLAIEAPAQLVPDRDPIAVELASVRETASRIDSMPILAQLTDQTGPRLTASHSAHLAEEAAMAQMRIIGLENVHAEPWTLARGWERGPAEAELVEPYRLAIPVAAYGWTGSTPAHPKTVPVVLLNTDDVEAHLQDLIHEQSARWNGKVLLLSSQADKPVHAYAQLLPLLRAATAAHAVAVFRHDTRPGNGLVHSEPISISMQPSKPDPTLIPALDLPLEHQLLIERLLRAKLPVRMSVKVLNHFTPGPVTSRNIVGEIHGMIHPDQVILIAAHLDSWDLGTGATDDGFGVVAVLGAAKAILQSGIHPERTIRFVLFTGEEQGLLGSRAYVHSHARELGRICVALALDWGAGPITMLPTAGHSELIPMLTRLNALAPELRLSTPNNGWMFMTDAYAFSLAGIPGIAPLVNDPRYSEQGHSAEDTLDKVNADSLNQSAAVLAVSGLFFADVPDLPCIHFSPEQTAASLIAGKQKPMLEALGLWPF
jgi:carboxypeptidase Q